MHVHGRWVHSTLAHYRQQMKSKTHTHTYTNGATEKEDKSSSSKSSAGCLLFFTCSHLERRCAQQNKAQCSIMSTGLFCHRGQPTAMMYKTLTAGK